MVLDIDRVVAAVVFVEVFVVGKVLDTLMGKTVEVAEGIS